MNKGFVFSFDSAFSILLLFSACFMFMTQLGELTNNQTIYLTDFSHTRKAISVMAAAVSDINTDNPVYGSAYYDAAKKRVIVNVIDKSLIENAKAGDYLSDNFFIQGIFLIFPEKELLIDEISFGRDCFGLERFVLVKSFLKEEKSKLRLVFCNA